MTLPAGVLYKSHHAGSKSGTTFTETGQDLTWSGIDLPKRGASLRLRLKVNVTNCADGQLAFAAATTVGGICPATATPATATVKHAKGWVACPPPPPNELCDIPTGTAGIFACLPGIKPGCDPGATVGGPTTAEACAQACQTQDYAFAAFVSGVSCECWDADDVTGLYTSSAASSFALGIPRSLPDSDCGIRRLSEGSTA